MADGQAIRGSKVGSGPAGEAERGESAPRRVVSYWCANGHESTPAFATDADAPREWECQRCGVPAGRDRDNPPEARRTEPYKSHFAYVQERRSEEEGQAILAEALERIQERRGR
ncbi:RNA polymerase-binding protein [Haloechinothrix alba]|uniref:RNA polymerase-binding protein RbpA n=2 Tax=Haloechinothrix TaxID=1425377 RepID=A0A238WZR2_9PSEU|nr:MULTISPECIES: RNA polymerase-binding protein RbpA [Haloechinothrix]MBA0125951.1 RNA polymerase-binding protein RbpA [Haloechinothrix aidingensis]SNR51089.1 RNA polymerase-binding protein [Haloechinothrix alba]